MKQLKYFLIAILFTAFAGDGFGQCMMPAPIVTDATCGSNNGVISFPVQPGCTFEFDYGIGNGPVPIYSQGNYAPGTYTIEIHNFNFPFAVAQITVIVGVQSGSGVNFTNIAITDNQCNASCNGEIQFNISSSNGIQNYIWSDGVSGSGSPTNRSNLCAGTYSVTVTENGGTCTHVETFTVNLNSLISVSNIVVEDNSCDGYCTGGIDFSASSPNGIYSYNWDNGWGGSYPPLTSLCYGNHTVTITDNSGCRHKETILVNNTLNANWHQATNNNTNQDDIIKRLLMDVEGNVYALGEFTAITEIDNQPISAGVDPNQKGIFVAKYSKCGQLLWLVHTENTNATPLDIEAFDMDFNNNQHDIVIFTRQYLLPNLSINILGTNNSIQPLSNKVTSISIDAASGSFQSSNVIDYNIAYAPFTITCAKADGNNYYLGGSFSGSNGGPQSAKAKKFNSSGTLLGDVIADTWENNLIVDIEISGTNIYAGVNLTTNAHFGISLIQQGKTAVVVEASAQTPSSTATAQLVAGGSETVIKDIEIDAANQLHVVGNYSGSFSGWTASQTQPISATYNTGYYVKFSTNLTSALTAYQLDETSANGINYASINAISIYSNRIHLAGEIKGFGFKITAAGMTTVCNTTSGFGNTSMWVAKFDYITTPSIVIWSNGSMSNDDVTVTDVVARHDIGAFFISGSYKDNITLPPSSSLAHFNPNTYQSGYVIRGGEFQSLNSGYYYKKGTQTTVNDPFSSIKNNGLKIYPNPTEGNFTLQYSSENKGDVYVSIFDVVGQQVFYEKMNKFDQNFEYLINNTFTTGVYIIELKEGEMISKQKIIIK